MLEDCQFLKLMRLFLRQFKSLKPIFEKFQIFKLIFSEYWQKITKFTKLFILKQNTSLFESVTCHISFPSCANIHPHTRRVKPSKKVIDTQALLCSIEDY